MSREKKKKKRRAKKRSEEKRREERKEKKRREEKRREEKRRERNRGKVLHSTVLCYYRFEEMENIQKAAIFGGLIDFTRQENLDLRNILMTSLREGRKFIDLFLCQKSFKV